MTHYNISRSSMSAVQLVFIGVGLALECVIVWAWRVN